MARRALWCVAVILLLTGCRPWSAWDRTAQMAVETAVAAGPDATPSANTPTDQPRPVETTTLLSPTPPPTSTATPIPPPTHTTTPTPTTTPCPAGTVQPGTFPSNLAGESKYRIYLPPCYGLDGRLYPTLYLFGGNTHDDSAWDDYGMDEVAEAAIQSGEIPPLLMIMVDGGWLANTTSGGPRSYEGHILDYLIPHIEENYCVWAEPAGRAIGGISRGGYWALEIAFRHPELFVSVGGHSAALIDSHAGPDVNPQYTALSNDLGDLRVYLDIGDRDYLLPNTQRLHEDMTAQGIPHTWVLNEGAHEDSYWPQHLHEYLLWYAEPWSYDLYPAGACG